MSYIGTVALRYTYVGGELCSAVSLLLSLLFVRSLAPICFSLFLSRRCSGDLHEIGGPSASHAYADLSLEWKSRIEIFSSAQQTRAAVRVRGVCVSARRFCIHGFRAYVRRSIRFESQDWVRAAYAPKNIGFAPPVSEISANLMRRTRIFQRSR